MLNPPTIPDISFPVTDPGSGSSASTGKKSTALSKVPQIPPIKFHERIISNEVISTSLDTQSRRILGTYQFGTVGALQIGKFVEGISGDIRISPEGIVGRNPDGTITFSIDRETGNATFRGQVAAGSLISGSIKLGGDGNSDGLLQLFNSAGVQVSQMDNNGLVTFGLLTGFRTAYDIADYEAGNVTGFIGSGTNLDMTFRAGLGIHMIFSASPDADFYMGITENGDFTVHGNGEFTGAFKLHGAIFDVTDDTYIFSIGTDVYIQNEGNVKTAIVPTTQGYRALYCMESPEVWFMDMCYLKPRSKWWRFWEEREYVIDPLFLETIVRPLHFVPTADKNVFQVWGIRRGSVNRRFEKKTKKEFIKNNAFWSTPTR